MIRKASSLIDKILLSFGGSKSGNPCERLMAPYLLDMRVIRRIMESVNPAVLVDSGLIVLLILCAKIQISERNTKYYLSISEREYLRAKLKVTE